MAVAFDAVAIPSAALYTATFSWTHTPVGTPKGVAVIIVQEKATDQVSGVTYGGVAMTRVRSDVRTVTEAGRVYIYFLGSSIPTGAQTVQVTLTGTEDTNAVSLTVTATGDTAVDTSAGADLGVTADPSLSIVPTVQAEIFYGIFSGLAAPVTTVQTGSTHVAGKDYGTDSAMWARKSASAGTTIGYTAASDDVCHSALAIKEYAAPLVITPTPIFGIAGIVIPTVILGSINIIASALSAIAQVVNPTVILGSLSLTPAPASAIGSKVDPTIPSGIVVIPTPIFAVASKVDPAVILGSLVLTPGGLGAVGGKLDPVVILGSIVIIPSPIDVWGGRANPTVNIQTLYIYVAPNGANSRSTSKQFTYQLAGRIHRKYAKI